MQTSVQSLAKIKMIDPLPQAETFVVLNYPVIQDVKYPSMLKVASLFFEYFLVLKN